ncbi:PQQ-binding-like beta-propeller repeat protein [Telmatospirillum sp.]|uniref:outer membrane protein assembly factor BamB family protein n=1 Tax=Telmatospirillum sp. TaxID=2079197 RepID=UPI0028446872|nr:PQQ-binding-like beta-propeller repeat protein [Telmatospirillum sp.]MDR3440861.1 PQQ-binding-like beta-propeller repeat protein [Telmatospirillum sp.]
MRRFALLLASCGFLAACGGDTWLGDTPAPPLPGKRISILSQSKTLEADAGSKGAIVLPAPEAVADWPQAGGYPPHAMHHLALESSSLHRVWDANIGAGASKRHAFVSQPVVSGGKVFAMDSESVVSSFALKDGRRLWKTDLAPEDSGDGSYGGGISFDEGKLYVTTQFAELVTLDAATGKVLWRRSLPAPVRGAPTVRSGRVLVITVDNATLALSTEDGHELWHHNGISEMASMLGGTSPAVDGNTVIAPYSSGELFSLRIENGTVQWSEVISSLKRTDQVATLTDIRGLPVVDRGRVFAAGNSDIFAAIDLRTGRRIWDREVGSIQTPWVAGDYVYLVTNGPSVACFEAQTGQVRWVKPLQPWDDMEDKTGRLVWTGPVLASDRLIVVSSAGEALSLSPYTGEILGREELPDGVTIAPIVAGETVLFVTTEGDLVAYR